jgi:chaperonin GroES
LIQPLKGKILAKRVAREEVSRGGIYLPQTRTRTEEILECIVISVGSEVSGIKEGHKIIIDKYQGEDFRYCGQDCLLIHADHILAVEVEDYEE